MVDAYPLTWPTGWERTPNHHREHGWRCKLTFGLVRDRVLLELGRLGTKHVVLSSNIPVRADGLPYSKFREPEDPGVAVWFERGGKPLVMARDAFLRPLVNLWSIGLAIQHLRGLERHGGGVLLERAFTGFLALPAPNGLAPWWEVLRVLRNESLGVIEVRYRELAKLHHPDKVGSLDQMIELNRAIADARKEKESANAIPD
jgi:hypothetical protein